MNSDELFIEDLRTEVEQLKKQIKKLQAEEKTNHLIGTIDFSIKENRCIMVYENDLTEDEKEIIVSYLQSNGEEAGQEAIELIYELIYNEIIGNEELDESVVPDWDFSSYLEKRRK